MLWLQIVFLLMLISSCYKFYSQLPQQLNWYPPATLQVPSSETKQFLAERSRCTYLWAPRYAIPSAISAAILITSGYVGGCFRSISWKTKIESIIHMRHHFIRLCNIKCKQGHTKGVCGGGGGEEWGKTSQKLSLNKRSTFCTNDTHTVPHMVRK